MLDESFEKIYRAFRLEYYKHFFSVLRERRVRFPPQRSLPSR